MISINGVASRAQSSYSHIDSHADGEALRNRISAFPKPLLPEELFLMKLAAVKYCNSVTNLSVLGSRESR